MLPLCHESLLSRSRFAGRLRLGRRTASRQRLAQPLMKMQPLRARPNATHAMMKPIVAILLRLMLDTS
jgi:hypothetical protein